MRNPRTTHIDQMDTMDILRCMQAENLAAVQAVERPLPSIAAAVDAITAAFQAGGRLFYIGAGTSGRLGVLDAAECPPTFGVPADKVVGIIAGGDASLRHASESAEDDPLAGAADLRQYALTAHDVVVGISAAGGAAYVLRALEYAAGQGCVTVGRRHFHLYRHGGRGGHRFHPAEGGHRAEAGTEYADHRLYDPLRLCV